MSHNLIRFIGAICLGAAALILLGMIAHNDAMEIAGIIVCAAASFWLAFLVKPASDKIADEERAKHKVP